MSSLCEVQNHPDMQYSFLSVLGNRDQNDVSRTLLGMSTSPETCAAMRSSGCLPLIIRLLYAPDSSPDMKKHVALALHNIVNSNPDEAQSKIEGRVLSLLESVRQYCDSLIHCNGFDTTSHDKSIGMTVASILRLSFDGDQRRAMSVLGGIHSIAYLIQVLHKVHGGSQDSIHSLMLKRYVSMTLTNLTSGHNSNKALLCSLKPCMHALVAQLNSSSEELQQATASVIRNLSWKADTASKQILRETGAISVLMKVAMKVRKESTLQSMLSALWNLSSNCSLNKIELCAIDGALGFLTQTLNYKSSSSSLCVVENAGGVLRNVSSHVAERESYRAILREYDCLQVLTQHLTSPSTRVIGNACIILWNLSHESPEDQYTLWMLGAPNLLRNLVHSKHKLIALGSSAALKNLLSGRPEGDSLYSLLFGPPPASSPTSSSSSETNHRRNKSVEEELDEVLSESRLKKDHVPSPIVTSRRDDKFVFSVTDVEKKRQQRRSYHKSHSLSRSGSREHLSSTNHESGLAEKKHSSNVDLSSNEDMSETGLNEEAHLVKHASLFMKDDTEGDLNFDNEAISTVDELLDVIKDMASLRLNEDRTTIDAGVKNETGSEGSKGSSAEVRPETSEEQAPGTTASAESKSEHNSVLEVQRGESETSDVCHVRKEEFPRVDRSASGEESVSVKQEPVSPPSPETNNGESDQQARTTVKELREKFETNDVCSAAVLKLKESPCLSMKQEPEELSKETSFEGETEPLPEEPKQAEDLPIESVVNENGPSKVLQTLDLTCSEEKQLSVEQTPSEEIISTDYYSSPKNVSLMSPLSVEDLPTDKLIGEDSSSLKKEPASSSEDLQQSLEKLTDELSCKVKKELATPEDLEHSLAGLSLEEDIKEDEKHVLLDSSNEGITSDVRFNLDFELGDVEEKPVKREDPDRESSPEGYGDYAETDLDQPTDYSLQYGEEDELTDEDEIQGTKRDPRFYSGVPISIHEDTVKTYCTEGTPFETPYNYSTATSMSDLRAEPSIKEEIDDNESETASVGQKHAVEDVLAIGSVQVEEKSVSDDVLLDRIHSVDTGLLSPPEKPVQFCEEGTPGQCISRFSSLSSLCGDANQAERPQIKEDISRESGSPFTNSGSEHGYQDIPDLSNSAAILVDTFGTTRKNDDETDDLHPKLAALSVFEDAVVSFKDETTPLNFSCATSLSSLSFDDEPKILMDVSLKRASSQKPDAESTPQKLGSSEENHSNPRLLSPSRFSSHQLRRKEVFPTQNSTQETSDLKPISPGIRSPRLTVKQENGSLLPGRSNGEDTDAYEDTTYRYCTEGTPANISYAGSQSDLSVLSIPNPRSGKLSDLIDESSDDNLSFSDDCENILAECIMSGMPKTKDSKRTTSKSLPPENGNSISGSFAEKESGDASEQVLDAKQPEDLGDKGKVVTFDNADHYAEETPLMFSRASSLASLSSFDQQSIVDDRSSIISDLSRLTSGAVSPSEIPDSSSQLISASPHRSKAPSVGEASDLERNSKPSFTDLPQRVSHQPFNKIEQTCVFEDDVKPFKVEDTPVQFSRATSLSSLSICDDANPAEDETARSAKDEREESKDVPKEEDADKDTDDESDKNSLLLESEGEDDDDAILAACISIGMQQSRKPADTNPAVYNNFKTGNRYSPTASSSNCKTDRSNNPVNETNQQVNRRVLSPTPSESCRPPKPSQQASSVNLPSRCSEPVPVSGAFDDVTHRYFTEDTPAISHAASQSDLSVLSFGKDDAQAEESGRSRTTTELSDDVFNVSDNEGMLAECIQAGMPKKNTTKKRNNSLTIYPDKEINGNLRQQLRDDRNGLENPRHTFKDERNGIHNHSPRRQVRDDRNGVDNHRYQSRDDKVAMHNLSPRHQSRDDRMGFENIPLRHQKDDRNALVNLSPRHLPRDERYGIENLSLKHQFRDDRNGFENFLAKHQVRDDRNGFSSLSPRHLPRDDCNGFENPNFPRHQIREDKNGFDTFHDRPRSNVSSQQLSPVLNKSKPTSRPLSANSHASSFTMKSSHSRKSRRALPDVEPRRMENGGAFEDSMYRFNTEDTPANISHAGSHSDISVLSIPDDDKEFFHDFHKHNIRQHSFHYLSDDSLDSSDNEHILAECIQSGMPKAKSSARSINRPGHSGATVSHSLPHHSLDLNLNSLRRPFNQGPVQQRHGSRSASRTSKSSGFTRRSLSQSDRPQNYPIDVAPGHLLPHQSYGNDVMSNRNDAILNRNVAAAGMWSNSSNYKLPFNRERDFMNTRTSQNYPNNPHNPHSYDSGWEMDPSILKDSQALRSLLLTHPNPRWLRKLRSTSPNHRRYSETQSSYPYYSRENSSNLLQSNGDLTHAKGPGGQTSQQPLSLPPNIRPLDRQRTFTKLEPSLHTHLPSPSSKTKIPVPAQAPTKLPEKLTSNSKKLASVEQVPTKGKSKSKTSITNSQPRKTEQVSDRMKPSKSSSGYTSASSKAPCSWSGKSTPTSTLRCHGSASPSVSSASPVFKQNTTERRSFRVSRQTGLEDKRSNSFSSITSSASSKSSVRPFKREVASKVASLWKRTDSSDDGQGKSNARNDAKSSDGEKRSDVTRKMVRSATFEGLPRNLELAKGEKVQDDSGVRPTNHVDRSKKTSHKSRFLSDKKESLNKGKSSATYNRSSENVHNSRDDPCTSVINRHDRAMSQKSSSKTDQSSVRVTKV